MNTDTETRLDYIIDKSLHNQLHELAQIMELYGQRPSFELGLRMPHSENKEGHNHHPSYFIAYNK